MKTDGTLVNDDMIFVPYETMGGWQCIMNTSKGEISVRYLGRGLFTDDKGCYEVWYPEDTEPKGYQTADDIWNYIGYKL